MVTAEQEEIAWVLHLVGHQQADRLQRVLAAIHIVAQEQIVGFRWIFAVVEQPKQVGVLSVDVACIVS